jgi:hypothetical protein
VELEVRDFLAFGRREHVFSLLVAGDPASLDGAPAGPFCPALRDIGGPDGAPLAADVRKGRQPKRVALLRLVAAMIGVSFDELWLRERRRLLWRLTWETALTLLLLGLALIAVQWTAKSAVDVAETSSGNNCIERVIEAARNVQTAVERSRITLAWLQDLAPRQELDPALDAAQSQSLNRIFAANRDVKLLGIRDADGVGFMGISEAPYGALVRKALVRPNEQSELSIHMLRDELVALLVRRADQDDSRAHAGVDVAGLFLVPLQERIGTVVVDHEARVIWPKGGADNIPRSIAASSFVWKGSRPFLSPTASVIQVKDRTFIECIAPIDNTDLAIYRRTSFEDGEMIGFSKDASVLILCVTGFGILLARATMVGRLAVAVGRQQLSILPG